MIGALLSILGTISALVLFIWFGGITQRTYKSVLEEYIVSHYPKDAGDVDRLTREYEQRTKRSFL